MERTKRKSLSEKFYEWKSFFVSCGASWIVCVCKHCKVKVKVLSELCQLKAYWRRSIKLRYLCAALLLLFITCCTKSWNACVHVQCRGITYKSKYFLIHPLQNCVKWSEHEADVGGFTTCGISGRRAWRRA